MQNKRNTHRIEQPRRAVPSRRSTSSRIWCTRNDAPSTVWLWGRGVASRMSSETSKRENVKPLCTLGNSSRPKNVTSFFATFSLVRTVVTTVPTPTFTLGSNYESNCTTTWRAFPTVRCRRRHYQKAKAANASAINQSSSNTNNNNRRGWRRAATAGRRQRRDVDGSSSTRGSSKKSKQNGHIARQSKAALCSCCCCCCIDEVKFFFGDDDCCRRDSRVRLLFGYWYRYRYRVVVVVGGCTCALLLPSACVLVYHECAYFCCVCVCIYVYLCVCMYVCV